VSETLYQLTVRKGPKVGEKFLLETISLTVGRDPVSDIILNDPEVSRQHARFTQTDTGYQVQDLGSTNGTFVNGQRLESELVDLEPGYTISMGSGVTLIYEVVPTGNALDATIVDQSGLDEMVQQGSGVADLDEAMDSAVPDLPLFEDEPEIPADWEPDPSPPFSPPPPSPAHAAPPLIATPEDDEAARQKRRNTIIAVTAVILLLCCCGFFIFMYYVGGDLLLESLGLV
jgi:predicted component of type VI protein secretion system